MKRDVECRQKRKAMRGDMFMILEKVSSSPVTPKNWISCPNCGYKDNVPPSSEYHTRLNVIAQQRNAANNGKGCVSS